MDDSQQWHQKWASDCAAGNIISSSALTFAVIVTVQFKPATVSLNNGNPVMGELTDCYPLNNACDARANNLSPGKQIPLRQIDRTFSAAKRRHSSKIGADRRPVWKTTWESRCHVDFTLNRDWLRQVKRLLTSNAMGFFWKIYSQMNAIQNAQKKNAKRKALSFLKPRFSYDRFTRINGSLVPFSAWRVKSVGSLVAFNSAPSLTRSNEILGFARIALCQMPPTGRFGHSQSLGLLLQGWTHVNIKWAFVSTTGHTHHIAFC